MPLPLPAKSTQVPVTKDPVELIAQIQTLLDQLSDAVTPPEAAAPPEFLPQSDQEVAAGLKPKEKVPPLGIGA